MLGGLGHKFRVWMQFLLRSRIHVGELARFDSGERMSNEREHLNRAFDRSRSRLGLLNLSLAGVLVIAVAVMIWLIVLDH